MEDDTEQIQTISKDQMMDQIGQLLQNGIDIMLVVQEHIQILQDRQFFLIKILVMVLEILRKDILRDIWWASKEDTVIVIL